MSLPGFTADAALGIARGTYRASHSAIPQAGVVPQLPIGPIGGGLGNCCCIDFNFGWFGSGITVSAMAARGDLPPWASAGVTTAGRAVNIGPFRIQCTECPQGDDDCQCSCGAGGTPCAQRGNVTVCEP